MRRKVKGTTLTKDDKEKIKRADWLFRRLEQERAQVVVPTVAVTEYLTPIPKQNHADHLSLISSRCMIAPFDVKAASIAAALFYKGKEQRTKEKTEWRSKLRADCCIVATAKAAGASVFYTNDGKCLKLAREVMDAYDLPDIPDNLWGYQSS